MLIERLTSEAVQGEYRAYYVRHRVLRDEKTAAFEEYIDSARFQDDVHDLAAGSFCLSVPERRMIDARRSCYVYPQTEAFLLGYVNYVLREVEKPVSQGVYSCPFSSGVRGFLQHHTTAASKAGSVVALADVQQFSDSIRRSVFIDVQRRLLARDPEGFAVIERLYQPSAYTQNGELHQTDIHLFMGTPLDSYSCNTMLFEIDAAMRARTVDYARYNDDIALVFSSRSAAEEGLAVLNDMISNLGLTLHPHKTRIIEPGCPYDVLGMRIAGSSVSLAPKTKESFLAPLRDMSRMLVKMVRRKQLDPRLAMHKMISEINLYLDHPRCKKQYLPLMDQLTGIDDLKDMDKSIQNWIRAVGAGTTSNAKYRITFKQLQAMGYRSIVSRYYARHKM